MKDHARIKRPDNLSESEILGTLASRGIPAEDVTINEADIEILYPYHPSGGARDHEFNVVIQAISAAKPKTDDTALRQRIAELESQNKHLETFVSKVQIELTAFSITDAAGKVIGISFDRALEFQREAMNVLSEVDSGNMEQGENRRIAELENAVEKALAALRGLGSENGSSDVPLAQAYLKEVRRPSE